LNARTFACLATLGVLGSAACSGEKAPAAAVQASKPAPSRPAPRTTPTPDAAGANPEGAYVLTKEKLDAYVRYQKALIGIYDGLLTALEKLPATALKPDAGRGAVAGANAAMRVLEGKARAEEQARTETGLSERDAREIERMVMAIVNKRNMGRSFDPTTAIKQWEAMREKVPADQRAELDKSINDLKEQQAELVKLSEERQQFGDANVDLILSREDELTQNYNAYLAKLTGRR